MMLSELFAQLSYGELRQTYFSDDETRLIKPEHYAEIISHINLGLTDLHKKFPLKTNELFIQQYSHISVYHLNSKYSYSNDASTEPYKYIIDSLDEPFKDDAIRIERIYDENGDEFYVNDGHNSWGAFLPNQLSIQLPQPDDANSISVIYRAMPAKILGTADPEIQEVDLPPVYLQPLLYYVASRVFAGIGSPEAMGTSNNYVVMYETACNDLKFNGVYNVEDDTNTNFNDNGWV